MFLFYCQIQSYFCHTYICANHADQKCLLPLYCPIEKYLQSYVCSNTEHYNFAVLRMVLSSALCNSRRRFFATSSDRSDRTCQLKKELIDFRLKIGLICIAGVILNKK
jgi:hypothetical protein